MDLQRVLDNCVTQQWSPHDLDWSLPPPAMTKAKEVAVVRYFTNMVGIERLAGALFEEQLRHTADPTLRQIFQTFVRDERRHALLAQMLADHYDVHHYQHYEQDPELRAFARAFVQAIHHFSAELANVYITAGEILLDIALLRSIDDYVDDAMSHQAMALINRDESRHIAIDFHMFEHYAARGQKAALGPRPRRSLLEEARAWATFASVLRHARPFFQNVFIEPMALCDPDQKRMKAAFKRIQLLSMKPEVRRRPFVRFLTTVQQAFNTPVIGSAFGRLWLRILGTPPSLSVWLHSQEEAEQARAASFDQLAQDTLEAKHHA